MIASLSASVYNGKTKNDGALKLKLGGATFKNNIVEELNHYGK
jgi:hypothetical protein